MNTLRKCIALAAATAAASAANADININDNLSISGFIDMSYAYTDTDTGSSSSGDEVFAVDQVETNFHYSNGDSISARVDIEYGESSNDDNTDDTFVEQAYITKQKNDQLSIDAGRFLSLSGWETEEPTGLYQYSGALGGDFASTFYGGYQQGVRANYDAGAVDVAVAVVNDLFDPTNSDNTQLGVELYVGIEPVEGVTAKLFYLTEADDDFINFWASYQVEALTLALEYNMTDRAMDTEDTGYLLMANYTFGDYGVTLRYADAETEVGSSTTWEADGITIAGSKACSDNLLLVAEYTQNTNNTGSGDVDTDTFALEALFTF